MGAWRRVRESGRGVRKRTERRTVPVVAGGSHSANLNRPEAVNQAIEGFLAALPV